MMPPPADAHVVGRQQRADGQQRYPQGQVDPAADVTLGLGGTDVQYEQIQQPERQPQADPAQQEAHKHHPGPLVPDQDQVNDQQLRVKPRQEGQSQDHQHRFPPPMPPLHRCRRRPQQPLAT
jgi:hypothetical protein